MKKRVRSLIICTVIVFRIRNFEVGGNLMRRIERKNAVSFSLPPFMSCLLCVRHLFSSSLYFHLVFLFLIKFFWVISPQTHTHTHKEREKDWSRYTYTDFNACPSCYASLGCVVIATYSVIWNLLEISSLKY